MKAATIDLRNLLTFSLISPNGSQTGFYSKDKLCLEIFFLYRNELFHLMFFIWWANNGRIRCTMVSVQKLTFPETMVQNLGSSPLRIDSFLLFLL
jgi:hypothetical protein